LISQIINSKECFLPQNDRFWDFGFSTRFSIILRAKLHCHFDRSRYIHFTRWKLLQGKWHSMFQMTRRYAWQRHTTRAVRTFIRLRSRTRQSATASAVVTQSFNPTLRPFLYSCAKLTCGMSKLPLCRSANNI